jgi:hypothetical protein
VLLIPFGVLLQSALGRLAWIDMIWRPALAGSAMFAVLGLGWTAQPILALIAAGALYPVVLFALKPLSVSEWAMLAPVLPARVKRLLPAQ